MKASVLCAQEADYAAVSTSDSLEIPDFDALFDESDGDGPVMLSDTLLSSADSLRRLAASYNMPLDSIDALIFAFRPMLHHRYYVHRVEIDTTLTRFHDVSNVVLHRYKVGAYLGNLGLSYYAPVYYMREAPSGFMVGKKSTSRIEALSVRSMTSRSMPMPRPPVGGMPYSRALTNS